MTEQLAIDFEHARAARDTGMAQALDHAESDTPGWGAQAYAFLARYAETHERFQIWMVVHEARKVIPADNEKAWGGPTLKAIKRGVIQKDGYAPNPRRHATDAPVYRSMVFKGAA